jgi:hypothetical protein
MADRLLMKAAIDRARTINRMSAILVLELQDDMPNSADHTMTSLLCEIYAIESDIKAVLESDGLPNMVKK